MKTIKSKILTGLMAVALVLMLPVATPRARAGDFKSFNFFQGDVVSLTVSNTMNYTNLNSRTAQTTNWFGLNWTNFLGSNIVVTSSTNANATQKITKDIPLYSNTLNIPMQYAGTNTVQNIQPTFGKINIELVGGSGADAAVLFVFQPLADGTNETTGTTDEWTVSVTPTTTTAVAVMTNVPAYLWQGCGAVRLKRIVNSKAASSGQVTVTRLSLNTFLP